MSKETPSEAAIKVAREIAKAQFPNRGENAWTPKFLSTVATIVDSALESAQAEALAVLVSLRDDIASRTARYESERDRCESGGEAWQRIEAMRVTASNILFQFDNLIRTLKSIGR